jgi:F0F1-type ATP synthase assembly protein I
MANPNIAALSTIKGQTAYLVPSTTSANTAWTYDGTTALTGLTPATSSVNKITGLIVSNITASAAATVAIGNNPTFGSATTISYLAYQISVPAGASLVVVDKTTDLYITENQSVAVTSGTANALTFTAIFENIS